MAPEELREMSAQALLQTLREEHHMTDEAIAQHCGVTTRALRLIASGARSGTQIRPHLQQLLLDVMHDAEVTATERAMHSATLDELRRITLDLEAEAAAMAEEERLFRAACRIMRLSPLLVPSHMRAAVIDMAYTRRNQQRARRAQVHAYFQNTTQPAGYLAGSAEEMMGRALAGVLRAAFSKAEEQPLTLPPVSPRALPAPVMPAMQEREQLAAQNALYHAIARRD